MLAPLQVVDSFLLNYNVGDAFVVVFALGLLATLPLRSRQLTTLHVIVFGLVFLLTPASAMSVEGSAHLLGSPFQYKMFGLLLLVVGPVLYASAKR
jgi:hypothetical protein